MINSNGPLQRRIEELEELLEHEVKCRKIDLQDNERLRAALDKACETVETRPQVGRSIDYANGFNRGVQSQRLRAKFARDAALETGND